MAELTQRVIAIVEDRKGWDLDIKQDFYVTWLEADEPEEFQSDEHIKNYVNTFYNGMLKNQWRKDNRRSELMEEFAATVAVHTAPEQGGNPPDILEAQEEVGARIDSLSPLLYDTLTAIAVDGIDVDLVAEVEGVTPDVIYKRLERAKTIVKGE